MSKSKLTFEQVKAEFTERGYELVSAEYHGVKDKIEYICPKHRDKGIQRIVFSKFHSDKQGCRYCAVDRLFRYDYQFVREEFAKRGYELLSAKYSNVSEKLDYVCEKHRDKGVQQISFSKLHNCSHGCYWCGQSHSIY